MPKFYIFPGERGGVKYKNVVTALRGGKEEGWIYAGVFRGGSSKTWLRWSDMVPVRRSEITTNVERTTVNV